MKSDVVVVGGGPAGLLVSMYIQTRDVVVLEEHSTPGFPLHCAGVVGHYVAEEVSRLSRRLIDARYTKAYFIYPGGKTLLEFKRPVAYHVNRPLLEEILSSKVESMGHKIVFNMKARPWLRRSVKTPSGWIDYDVLIVAEGVNGVFHRAFCGKRQEYLMGLQIRGRASEVEEDAITVIYSDETPDFFAWITPLERDYVQIGYASRAPRKGKLIKICERFAGIKVTSIETAYGGLIPTSKPMKNPVLYKNIVFHGDAVPLTKPYTGGGLYYIFKLSPILAKHVEEGTLEDYFRSYKGFLLKSTIEHSLTSFMRSVGYHFPAPFISGLKRLGIVREGDYDDHHALVLKALALLPISPFLPLLQHKA
jgi:flavin-dependent dehydrogenase